MIRSHIVLSMVVAGSLLQAGSAFAFGSKPPATILSNTVKWEAPQMGVLREIHLAPPGSLEPETVHVISDLAPGEPVSIQVGTISDTAEASAKLKEMLVFDVDHGTINLFQASGYLYSCKLSQTNHTIVKLEGACVTEVTVHLPSNVSPKIFLDDKVISSGAPAEAPSREE